MTGIIALVSCVKQKRSYPMAAKQLYTSALFRKMRAYSERHSDCWYILSAKYGLVHPESVIEPYEQTLNSASAGERRAWARHVYAQMAGIGILQSGTAFLWLAGRKYIDDLAPLLHEFSHLDPLKGMAIGQRLSWLNQSLRMGT